MELSYRTPLYSESRNIYIFCIIFLYCFNGFILTGQSYSYGYNYKSMSEIEPYLALQNFFAPNFGPSGPESREPAHLNGNTYLFGNPLNFV